MCAKLFFVSIIAIIGNVQMSNILVLLPTPMISHTNNFMPIFRALANKGHNVTVVSPFPQKTPVPNLTDIVVISSMEKLVGYMSATDIASYNERLFQLIEFWVVGIKIGEISVQNEAILKLIDDTDSKFDLIMTETFMFHEPLIAFGHKFKAPVINLHPSILPASASYYTGNVLPSSYSPSRFSSFTDHMTFLERAETAFFHTWELLTNTFYFLRKQEQLMRKYFQNRPGLEDLPPLIDMLRNTSLTLINHNSAIGYPFPTQRNIVEFGGINMKSGDKLPKDIQEIMDNSKEGVIYFSIGSYFNISMLPDIVQSTILSSLGKLKQKVLIKWEKPTVKDKIPNNLELRQWFPQTSVLAHPNCRLFVTHGGIHSTMEAIYYQVPMVVIPLFADQKYNAKFLENDGIAITLNIKKISGEILFNSINTVLKNPRFKENIKVRSAIFKDTAMNTLDNVIYWIEYVIRHKGAPHLKPAVLDLYWYQELMLDVIAFYLFVVIVIIYIIKTVLKLICKGTKWLLCKNCAKDDKKKSKME